MKYVTNKEAPLLLLRAPDDWMHVLAQSIIWKCGARGCRGIFNLDVYISREAHSSVVWGESQPSPCSVQYFLPTNRLGRLYSGSSQHTFPLQQYFHENLSKTTRFFHWIAKSVSHFKYSTHTFAVLVANTLLLTHSFKCSIILVICISRPWTNT